MSTKYLFLFVLLSCLLGCNHTEPQKRGDSVKSVDRPDHTLNAIVRTGARTGISIPLVRRVERKPDEKEDLIKYAKGVNEAISKVILPLLEMKYLFLMEEKDVKNKLNEGSVHADLKSIFEEKQHVLSSEASLTKKTNTSWLIKDVSSVYHILEYKVQSDNQIKKHFKVFRKDSISSIAKAGAKVAIKILEDLNEEIKLKKVEKIAIENGINLIFDIVQPGDPTESLSIHDTSLLKAFFGGLNDGAREFLSIVEDESNNLIEDEKFDLEYRHYTDY